MLANRKARPMMLDRRALLAGLAAAPVLAGTATASEGGFTPALFEAWVRARIGDGAPVYWYSTGTAKAYPSGDLMFLMEGFDAARMFRPDPARPLVHQYNRKIYVFRDPKTGEILKSHNGKPVEPIAYPYQFITYELKGDRVETFVEQGRAPRVQRIGPGGGMSVRTVGDTHIFSAPVFLDFPIPGGERRYQAFENYDFYITPNKGLREPNQLSWLRYGPLPAWADAAPSIMHLVTWRIDTWGNVPSDLRAYVEQEQPLWQAPPADLAEIRRLQASA
jgi:hypothetical protein